MFAGPSFRRDLSRLNDELTMSGSRTEVKLWAAQLTYYLVGLLNARSSSGPPATVLVFTCLISLCGAIQLFRSAVLFVAFSIQVQEHDHSSFPTRARSPQANPATTPSTSSARSSCWIRLCLSQDLLVRMRPSSPVYYKLSRLPANIDARVPRIFADRPNLARCTTSPAR
jgi:hypothetical protein